MLNAFLPARLSPKVAVAIVAALWILLLLALVAPPTYRVIVTPAQMSHNEGLAFTTPIASLNSFLFRVRSDTPMRGASRLVLTEDGSALGPAHALHADVRNDGKGAYSHWGDVLYFSTSDNTDPRQNGRTYSLLATATLHGAVPWLAAAATVLLMWLSREGLSSFRQPATAAFVLIVRLAWIGCLTIASIYLAIVLPRLFSGDVFAAATPLRWIGFPAWLIGLENGLPRTIVALALLGSLAVWLSLLGLLDGDQLRAIEHELLFGRLRFGSPVIAALLLTSLGTAWLGVHNPSQYAYGSLFGQLPNSDALNYISSSLGRIAGLEMSSWAARRPVAQSFRDLTVWLAGGSYTVTLMVQTLALALALAFAARRLMLWRGVWAGMALVGLVLLHSRFFITSTMTEPLGMFCALVCIGFLVDAARYGSTIHGLLALAWLSLALFIRMGALLVIPAVALWIVLALSRTSRERLAVAGCAGAIIVGVIALGWLLKTFYAAPGAQIGGNFAHTLCGLSVGGDWSTCAYKLYTDEVRLIHGEAELSRFYLAKAIDNSWRDPMVLVRSLAKNVERLFAEFIHFFTTGYYALPRLPQSVEVVVLVLALSGLAYLGWFHGSKRELCLWSLIGAGIVASAAVIMADDGWRALHVTHALIASFIAMGCISSAAPLVFEKAVPIRKAFIATAAFVMLLAAGPHLLARLGPRNIDRTQVSDAEHVLLGGKQTLGLIVVEDTETRLSGPGVVRWSEFRKGYERTYKTDADVPASVVQMEKRLPFGLVVDFQQKRATTHLIVPVEVLTRTDVARWKIRIDPSFGPRGLSILVANSVSAEPLSDSRPAHR